VLTDPGCTATSTPAAAPGLGGPSVAFARFHVANPPSATSLGNEAFNSLLGLSLVRWSRLTNAPTGSARLRKEVVSGVNACHSLDHFVCSDGVFWIACWAAWHACNVTSKAVDRTVEICRVGNVNLDILLGWRARYTRGIIRRTECEMRRARCGVAADVEVGRETEQEGHCQAGPQVQNRLCKKRAKISMCIGMESMSDVEFVNGILCGKRLSTRWTLFAIGGLEANIDALLAENVATDCAGKVGEFVWDGQTDGALDDDGLFQFTNVVLTCLVHSCLD